LQGSGAAVLLYTDAAGQTDAGTIDSAAVQPSPVQNNNGEASASFVVSESDFGVGKTRRHLELSRELLFLSVLVF